MSRDDRRPPAPEVSLRPIRDDDLTALFGFESDPEANRLAAVVPRDETTFREIWSASTENPDVTTRAIVADGELAGRINAFPVGDETHVGYWIGRAYWGRGIGGRALAQFLREFDARPLHAVVAAHNEASIRMLRRCGFRITGERDGAATERYLACREVLLLLP